MAMNSNNNNEFSDSRSETDISSLSSMKSNQSNVGVTDQNYPTEEWTLSNIYNRLTPEQLIYYGLPLNETFDYNIKQTITEPPMGSTRTQTKPKTKAGTEYPMLYNQLTPEQLRYYNIKDDEDFDYIDYENWSPITNAESPKSINIMEEPYLIPYNKLPPESLQSYNLGPEEFFYDYGSREYLNSYNQLSPSQLRFYRVGIDGPDSHIPLYNKLTPEQLKLYGLRKDEWFYDEGSREYLNIYNKLTLEEKVLYGLIGSLEEAKCDRSDIRDSPYGLTRRQKCFLQSQILKKKKEEEKLKAELEEKQKMRQNKNEEAFDIWLKNKLDAIAEKKKQEKKTSKCPTFPPDDFYRDPALAYKMWLHVKQEEDEMKAIKLKNIHFGNNSVGLYKQWTQTCFKRLCEEI